ncbi:sucrose transport protein SUC2 [Beta vulgaris subsp. vulgaris]|uniref:sucrose transport protein SUC2 n=1 Tax=Beta vulgaris subsp. vulgaris TaxID=3555 RepID=UPI0020371229|nr:sucrose transport protein SUC2 [Beta vulgaris subsp. vulgaris]
MNTSEEPSSVEKHMLNESTPTWKIIAVASIAAGVQFGWALQLSLLTPYVQLLGVSHTMSSLIWLCGPVSGIVVQPTVGYISDRLTSKYGRRKPFITSGTILICLAVLLIGYAADIGHSFGDDLSKKTKPRAVALFVIGFWILDIANNMVQDPSRAFLADLSRHDHRKMRMANGFFSFFMAVGNILGYGAGSAPALYKIVPFTKTTACDTYCANLKTCFMIDILLLVIVVVIALVAVDEPPIDDIIDDGIPFFTQVKTSFKNLGKPMWLLFLVTAFNWIAWFPFLMFNTDWVGLEIYGGNPQGNAGQMRLYDMGVRTGALGLLLTAATLGCMSLCIDPLSKMLGGARRLWGLVNFVLAAALACTLPLTKAAEKARRHMPPNVPPSSHIKSATLGLFAATGIPQAATFSIPFALASMFSSDSGAGHGLSLGLMNLAICVPQMFVSLISGPWDKIFGGGNLPAFLLGAVAAVISGILAIFVLPPTSSNA